MPGVEKVLKVTWAQQQNTYYCGPAVAHMFLNHFGADVSQDVLWEDIKAHTPGMRPPGAPIDNTDPTFPQQVCFNCDGLDPPQWTCWNTIPEALQKTLQTRVPRVGTEARYPATANAGIQELIRSIDRATGVPALATETSQSHWVVVNGYLRDDATSKEFPPQQVGKYLLNALYVVDPNGVGDSDRFGFKTVNAWRADFGSIGCEANPHNNGYPMIVGAGPVPRPVKTTVGVALALCTAALLWLWWSSRDEE